MNAISFKSDKKQNVVDAISSNFDLSYSFVQKILRNKDIKINGKRISENVEVSSEDEILFYSEINPDDVDVAFEDENLIVVYKPKKMETVSLDKKRDLLSLVNKKMGFNCYAVHRLDRNTDGLVVFAKNLKTKNSLDFAIKNRKIQKFYLALVYGKLEKQFDDMVAYLKKDEKNSFVQISAVKKDGFEKIETKYKLLKTNEDSSLVEVELVTGKTHQIRAHFASLGHFVLGDEKYGSPKINKEKHLKFQCLTAYKIVFHFEKDDYLSYLNDKFIVLDEKFLKSYK